MIHVFTNCLTHLSRIKNSGEQDLFERDEKSLGQMMGILAVFRLFDQINCPTFVPSISLASFFFPIDVKH